MGLFIRVKSKIQTREDKRKSKSSFLDFPLLNMDVPTCPELQNQSKHTFEL